MDAEHAPRQATHILFVRNRPSALRTPFNAQNVETLSISEPPPQDGHRERLVNSAHWLWLARIGTTLAQISQPWAGPSIE